MSVTVGLVALGIYAALLAAGGVMGYVKAASRPSLIAGLACAAATLVALAVGLLTTPASGFVLGLLIAAGLAVFFFARWRKSRKFMPAGMLSGLSAVMSALLLALLVM